MSTHQEWIPVTERLPEEDWEGYVFIRGDGGGRRTGSWFNGYTFDIEHENVTHWMPLPEPPNTERK